VLEGNLLHTFLIPLRHLAALAIAGDVERLNSYKNSFEKATGLDSCPTSL